MNSFILNNKNTSILTGVKAIIYNSKGQILLQQRDNINSIPLPNFWNFFGGLVEKNEISKKALERELFEELECLPGKIDNKVFEWHYGNEWQKTKNIFYPVKLNINLKFLKLKEGKLMKWFNFNELVHINCTQSIYQNIYHLFIFLKKNKYFDFKNELEKYEKNILKYNNLLKKNERVYYALDKNFSISSQQIFLFKELSKIKKIRVSRICLHRSDDDLLHEMIMIHTKKTSVGPLKQKNNSISYHILEGNLSIITYSKNKKKLKKYNLSKDITSIFDLRSIRIDPNKFREIKSNSLFCIFLEITNGPFNDNDTIWLK